MENNQNEENKENKLNIENKLKTKINQKEINILKSNIDYDNLILPPIPNIKKQITYKNWLELNKNELDYIYFLINNFKKFNLLNEMEIDNFYKFMYKKSNINL